MEPIPKNRYNPLCVTFIFMVGILLGSFIAQNSIHVMYDVLTMCVATISFYITQLTNTRLFLNKN
jgi:hypothetical protein